MKLFICVKDCGDGSYYPTFILDEKIIREIKELEADGIWDYENGFGTDGDGFHYTTVNVPDGSTSESLGVGVYTQENLKEWKIRNL